jgi:hypothetical protein
MIRIGVKSMGFLGRMTSGKIDFFKLQQSLGGLGVLYLMTPMYCRYEISLYVVESRLASSHWAVAVTCCTEGGSYVHL